MPPIQKICKITGKPFVLTEKDQAFYDKMQVPYPEICHEERVRRKMLFRNERTLYKRKCDRTGKPIISMYSPEVPFPVYHRDEWWKDGWSPPEQAFDFNRPFFEQFTELRNKCPRSSVFNKRSYNSDFCNVSDGLKDCFMAFTAFESRNLLYCDRTFRSNDLTDCYYCTNVQMGIQCVYCFDSFNLSYSVECRNCTDSAFLYDCIGCKHCFMSTNLRQKEYYIFNQPHTKEEYETKMKQLDLGSHTVLSYLKDKFKEFREKNAIIRSNKNDQCEESSGHHLFNCKNVEDTFEIEDSRDILRCIEGLGLKDCADCIHFGQVQHPCELGYELQECVDFYNFKFCNFCYSKDNMEYSEECHNCSNCFGCAGLKNESFRIFNKKYPEAEYYDLKAKIIEHMKKTGEYGSFFPPSHSPFAYNETEATLIFPLEKEEALKRGFRWKEDLPSVEGVASPVTTMEDHINKTDEGICKKVFACESSGKKFAISAQELAFYKRAGIALPRRSPNERHKERLKERRVVNLYDRPCTKCGIALKSAYPGDLAIKVYCDECYFKEVY